MPLHSTRGVHYVYGMMHKSMMVKIGEERTSIMQKHKHFTKIEGNAKNGEINFFRNRVEIYDLCRNRGKLQIFRQ